MTKQTRQISFDSNLLHLRSAENGEEKSREVEGYACVWNTRSINLTPWSESRVIMEVMDKGCITQELINRSHIVLTTEHNPNGLLGQCRNGEGTLKVTVDDKGLYIRCSLPETQHGNDTLTMMDRGDLCHMSFAYLEADTDNAVEYERTAEIVQPGNKQVWLRHVKEVAVIRDVTICAQPCYYSSEVHTRSFNDDIDNIEKDEQKRSNVQAEEAQKKAHAERMKHIRMQQNDLDIMEASM